MAILNDESPMAPCTLLEAAVRLYLENVGKKKLFNLRDGEYLVGRDPAADIRIARGDVSKRHALFRVAEGRLFISDLGSRNGTDVDGVLVTPEHQEIEVMPRSTVHLAGVAVARSLEMLASPANSMAEIDSSLAKNETQDLVGSAPRNVGKMLSALFALIATDSMTEGFEDQACLFVSRWINCDRAMLMLDFGPGSQLDVWGSWSRTEDSAAEFTLPDELIDEVCEKRTSLLLSHGSAMVVPLFDNDRVRGILYADSLAPRIEFNLSDLDILTATANAIAIKLSNRDNSHAMTIAEQIQKRMCPSVEPHIPGYEVAARLESCFAIGGDFYHVGEPIDGKVLIAVGDVAGKGLPAALAMAACSVLIPALNGFCDRPSTLVRQLHSSLKAKLSRDQYVTLFLGELDLAGGELRYVNAGHVAPMIVRDNGEVARLGSTGGVIGMFPEFHCQGERILLAPGDLLTVFSDGVTEATIHGDEFFEREAAEAVILENREANLEAIMEVMFTRIGEFLKGGHGSDDTTLLMLRREDQLSEGGIP